jgi:hypothetical protein
LSQRMFRSFPPSKSREVILAQCYRAMQDRRIEKYYIEYCLRNGLAPINFPALRVSISAIRASKSLIIYA